jgi:hypothetical protein
MLVKTSTSADTFGIPHMNPKLPKLESIQEARALLAEQIGKIALVPNDGEYVAKGSVDFFGEMGLRTNCAGGPNATTSRVPFCIPLAA